MPRRLIGNDVPTLIWIYGSLSDILNIGLVKTNHFRRECEHRQSVNFLMPEKSPSTANH
jgi:hypothetical protein